MMRNESYCYELCYPVLPTFLLMVSSFTSCHHLPPTLPYYQVDRFIVRDSDSRLNPRDALAVAEWVASGANLHTVGMITFI